MNHDSSLPSLQALTDPDERRLLSELRLLEMRRQMDALRAMADALERRIAVWMEERETLVVGPERDATATALARPAAARVIPLLRTRPARVGA